MFKQTRSQTNKLTLVPIVVGIDVVFDLPLTDGCVVVFYEGVIRLVLVVLVADSKDVVPVGSVGVYAEGFNVPGGVFF